MAQIREDHLETILDENPDVLPQTLMAAQAEMENYLRHRYVVSSIFSAILTYAPGGFYPVGSRVGLKLPGWLPRKSYRMEGQDYPADMVSFNGRNWYAATDHYDEQPGAGSAWVDFGAANALYVPLVETNRAPYTDVWEQKDTRDSLIKMYLIDFTLYHLHCRIAPRLIPEHRLQRYKDAVDHLKMLANGKLDSNLPEKEAPEGRMIRYGSGTKQSHYW